MNSACLLLGMQSCWTEMVLEFLAHDVFSIDEWYQRYLKVYHYIIGSALFLTVSNIFYCTYTCNVIRIFHWAVEVFDP